MNRHSGLKRGHPVLSLLPEKLRPYGRLMRLDRPIGWWLLLLPCWWSVALAWSTQNHDIPLTGLIRICLLFLAGSILMRGAGCVVNDLWDRDFDAKVARTRARPLVSGEITVRQALVFAGVLSLAGLLVLVQFNTPAILWGLASAGLILVYPLAKRVTDWPQFVLGLAFNWGALLGWIVVTGSLHPAAVLMYAAGICWTLCYDTVYAHQDKQDDLIVGVKSTALKFGGQTKIWLSGFSLAQLVFLCACGFVAGAGIWFFGAAALAFALFLHQLYKVDTDVPEQCGAMFKAQMRIGLTGVIGGLLAGI